MADKTTARSRADTHFSAAEARTQLVKTELAKERIAFDNRTVKLKALRLAHEAEQAAAKAQAASSAKVKKAAKVKKTVD